MTNADKFKDVFGIFATELWSKPENEFLKWLNADFARANYEEHKAKFVDHERSNCGFWLTYGIVDYCPGCGARLDWSDVNG